MLDTIPLEILIEIIACVNKPDLLNLRLASRRLRQETWQAFGSAFFHTVDFEFCIGSFASLEKIAQHDDLRLFVRELRVGDGCCRNDGCRALRIYHRLGQGYKWIRDSSGCIDTTASEMAISFRSTLTERLSNCRAICMRQGSEERPGDRGSDTLLSMNDAVHLLLFSVSELPISSLRFDSIAGVGIQPQELPRRVIESPASTAPWADFLTELQLDWQIYNHSDLVHIAANIITRAKALRRLHLDFFVCDASAILSRLIETPEVPPLTHLVLRRFHTQERQLSSFIRRFKDTLLYLHMSSIVLDSGEWANLLSESRHNLLRLEHFTLSDAKYMYSQQPTPCFFDYILEWTGVPASGIAVYLVNPFRTSPAEVWRFRVSGFRYQGQCNDVQKILTGLEECARMNVQNHENEDARAEAGWNREDLPWTLVIAGRLKADVFKARKFDSIFARPPHRVPQKGWPPCR